MTHNINFIIVYKYVNNFGIITTNEFFSRFWRNRRRRRPCGRRSCPCINTAFTFVSDLIFTRSLCRLSEHPSHFSCQNQPPPGCTVLPFISSSPGSHQGPSLTAPIPERTLFCFKITRPLSLSLPHSTLSHYLSFYKTTFFLF